MGLQASARCSQWQRGTWTAFGKTHVTPRTHRTFQLTGLTERGLNIESNREEMGNCTLGKSGATHAALLNLDADVRSAGAVLEEQVRLRRPWHKWCASYALGNRYADGNDTVGPHSDFLGDLGPRPIIVGLTLGACRPFVLQRKVGGSDKLTIPLPHNSAIVMWGDCQENWHHSVPRCSGRAIGRHRLSGTVRFSLTFRMNRRECLPGLGKCHCGKPASLKCVKGRYVVFCHPNTGNCGFMKSCEWATEEARRLRLLDEGERPKQNSEGEKQ